MAGWDLRYISEARLKNDQEPEEEEVLEAFAQDLPCPPRQQPPFAWKVASEFEREFEISGSEFDVVTKLGDFKDPHWVVPVGGTLRLLKEGMDDQLDQLEIGWLLNDYLTTLANAPDWLERFAPLFVSLHCNLFSAHRSRIQNLHANLRGASTVGVCAWNTSVHIGLRCRSAFMVPIIAGLGAF
ncbi:unnamed protein product [Durusdinium trenchii]|uniref:Uncharacterized protein n=1 Tax=Durusdinium trenchii TaxID=1381693 RepID=A0ABP0P1S0_9DINO